MNRDQIIKFVYQNVKMMIIGMHNSKLLRKFSTKKRSPRNDCSVPQTRKAKQSVSD